MAKKNNDLDTLIKLGAIGIGAYLLYKILSPSETDQNKEIYRCGNCDGVLVGKPKYCRWCHVELDWSGL